MTQSPPGERRDLSARALTRRNLLRASPVLAAGLLPAAAAAQAGMPLPRLVRDAAELKADVTLAYGAGPEQAAVVSGDLICSADGHCWQVAAPDATDHDLETAGGAKLRVLPGADGTYALAAWGPAADGIGDDFPIILRACRSLMGTGEPWTLRFGPHPYRLSGEIDLTAAPADYALIGHREQTRIVPDPFGPAKACFRHAGRRMFSQTGFEFSGSDPHKNHPIGIEMRESGRATLRDITSGRLGNTVLFVTRPFNADWSNLDLFFSGWQPLHREVPTGDGGVTLAIRSGSTRATASSDVFQPDDLGKQVLIHHDRDANEAIIVTIEDYHSRTEVTLSRPMVRSAESCRFSFGPITASATGRDIVFARDIGLEAADVGRMIYVDRAGADGTTHVSRIAAVRSGRECTLEADVATEGIWRVFFTPTIYIGDHGITGTGPNDIAVDTCLVEGFQGPGVVVDGGLHIRFKDLKTHGRTWGEFDNFGVSAEAMLWNGAHKSRIDSWQLEFCGKASRGGTIRVAGQAPGLSIGYLSHNAPLVGGYLFDAEFADPARASLVLPEINGRGNLDRFDGLVRTSSAAVSRRVFGSGRVGASEPAVEASVQWPQLIGAARALVPAFIEDAAVLAFTPASPAGFLLLAADDAQGFWGLFKYNRAGIVLVTGQGASAGGDGSDGTESGLDVGFANGQIVIRNNTGAGRRFHASVLG